MVIRAVRKEETIRRIRDKFGENVPDSGQEHPANGDDGFLVTPVSLDAAITFSKFWMRFGTNHCIGDLNQ